MRDKSRTKWKWDREGKMVEKRVNLKTIGTNEFDIINRSQKFNLHMSFGSH